MKLSRSRPGAPSIALRRRAPQRSNRVNETTAQTLPDFDLDGFLHEAEPSIPETLRGLDVERRARSDGRQNHPPSDAIDFTAFEDRLVDHVSGSLKRVASDGSTALRRLRREIDDGLAALQPPDFEGHERDVALALEDRRSHIRYDLRDLFKRRTIAERNLNYFRRSLGVTRPAQYPVSAIYHFGLLLFVLVLESIANAYFFAQASDLGLLGGVLQAAVLSLVNVAWSFGFGLTAYRFLNAPQIGFRLLAGMGVMLHIAGAIFINLAIAHYRDLIAVSPDNATFAVLSRVVETPFHLEAFESLMLFLIGALIAAFAVWKGYTTDDPLPGYGPADRAYSEVDIESRAAREQLLSEAEAALDAAREPIDEDLAQFEDSIADVKDRLETLRLVADAMNDANSAHQRLCTSLLKTYREENLAVRNEPPPPHFDVYPEIGADIDAPDIDDITQRIRLLEDLIEDAREEASNSRARLQALHERNRTELDALFMEAENTGGRMAVDSFPAAFDRNGRAPSSVRGGQKALGGPSDALLESPEGSGRRRVAEQAAAAAALMEDDRQDRGDASGQWDNDRWEEPGARDGRSRAPRRGGLLSRKPRGDRRRGGAA